MKFFASMQSPPKGFTIRKLAETLVEMTGPRSEFKFLPLAQDESTQREPDISLAIERLGWEPRTQVREGLVPTIAYFDKLL